MPTDPYVPPARRGAAPAAEPRAGRATCRRRGSWRPTAPATSGAIQPRGRAARHARPERRLRAHARPPGHGPLPARAARARGRRGRGGRRDRDEAGRDVRAGADDHRRRLRDRAARLRRRGARGRPALATRRRARRRPRLRGAPRDRGHRERGVAAPPARRSCRSTSPRCAPRWRAVPPPRTAPARPIPTATSVDPPGAVDADRCRGAEDAGRSRRDASRVACDSGTGGASDDRARPVLARAERGAARRAAPGPRCSTGCSPVTAAARSSLRIEDTDRARTREEWIDGIQGTLDWLGLDWDETPWRQSERVGEYLVGGRRRCSRPGDAYECYCTPEELEAMHAERKAGRAAPGLRRPGPRSRRRGACPARGRGPARARCGSGRPTTGRSTFTDLVRGEVSVEWSTISDFVIVRSDGSPLFFLANAVDDLAMGITHVIRGEDLIDTTHRVLAIRRALGARPSPLSYAHLPLHPRGRPRQAVEAARLGGGRGLPRAGLPRRGAGELPRAARVGRRRTTARCSRARRSSPSSTLDRVTPSAAFFDEKKLDWLNGEYIRRLSLDELVGPVFEPFAVGTAGRPAFDPRDAARATAAVGQERASTIVALVDQIGVPRPPTTTSRSTRRVWDGRCAKTERGGRSARRGDRAPRDAASGRSRRSTCAPPIEALGVEAAARRCRCCTSRSKGDRAGLPLFDSIHLLGRERSARRASRARARSDRLPKTPRLS